MNKKKLNIVLLVLWIVFIFVMSSFNADDSTSQSNIIVDIICKLFSITDTSTVSLIVRKLAHFTEYFVLGILTINCFKDYKLKHLLVVSILFCVLYASSDEIHQLFVPGRGCSAIDVLIDSVGSIVGIMLYKIRFIIKNKEKQN